jgi:hypothetical protein
MAPANRRAGEARPRLPRRQRARHRQRQFLRLQLFADFRADAHQVGTRRLHVARQKASFIALFHLVRDGHPAPARIEPMMCRTTTSLPKWPARLTTSSEDWVSPTSVARKAAIAASGCSSVTCRSSSRTSRAASPSSSVTRLWSAPVMCA